MANYLIEQLDEVEPTPCPCGLAKRAFVDEPSAVASLHEVDIRQDSAVHYHKRTTEIYLVLEGEGHIEWDGERVAVKPMSAVYIKPGCRHRAAGPGTQTRVRLKGDPGPQNLGSPSARSGRSLGPQRWASDSPS